jgi:HSP90 family molecular chaperone
MNERTWEEINKDIEVWDQRQHRLRVEQAKELYKEGLEAFRKYLAGEIQ